jgi:hypothetical protein
MTTAALSVTTFPVGKKYHCTLTIQQPEPGGTTNIVCEWKPCRPRGLNKKEQRDYRQGRDKALLEVAQKLRGNVACIEL